MLIKEDNAIAFIIAINKEDEESSKRIDRVQKKEIGKGLFYKSKQLEKNIKTFSKILMNLQQSLC